MFEFSVACKYLVPRWRQLSVSIISMISILVIALVVWLILVFFSVTNGLEKTWVQKLIALTAPIRITPTEEYYNSYYYLVDGISENSDYTLKSIGEKRIADSSNPHNPSLDEPPPLHWKAPDLDANGNLKDPVKLAFAKISEINGINATDYEMSAGNLTLAMERKNGVSSQLSEGTYLGSLDPHNPQIHDSTLSLSMEDIQNTLSMIHEKERFKTFFDEVLIKELKLPEGEWTFPTRTLLEEGSYYGLLLPEENRLLLPEHAADVYMLKGRHETGIPATLKVRENEQTLIVDGQTPKEMDAQIALIGTTSFPAKKVSEVDTPRFSVKIPVQEGSLSGVVLLDGLEIADAKIQTEKSSFWAHRELFPDGSSEYVLPKDPVAGDGVLLPRKYRDANVKVGDRGYLSYYSPTTSSVQEQRVPIFVAGFYDPGIIPIGAKYVLANQEITSIFRAAHNQEDRVLSNGINIRMENLDQADAIKAKLSKAFEEEGIAPYWKIETFREFDFTKDLIQQLRSEKNLFTLISTVIIIVACSNIISMLIILVNDKKVEIGILRSMGATSFNIATIFGFCGIVMGLIGSLIGAIAAKFTLNNLQSLVGFISRVQGYEMFNPVFYGETLPNEMSFDALSFVVLATVIISLLAGIVPAAKASMLRPSAILRSE